MHQIQAAYHTAKNHYEQILAETQRRVDDLGTPEKDDLPGRERYTAEKEEIWEELDTLEVTELWIEAGDRLIEWGKKIIRVKNPGMFQELQHVFTICQLDNRYYDAAARERVIALMLRMRPEG